MNPLLKVIQLYKNEKQLIKKAASNHRDAQHMLYQLHAPKMLSVCRYYIKDVHQAEEVMLNGFFKVFTQLKSYKAEGSFEGWLRKIMVRESISFLRQQKQIEFSIEDTESDDAYAGVVGGGRKTVCFTLLSGLLSCGKMLPLSFLTSLFNACEPFNVTQLQLLPAPHWMMR